jgi:hypothetical protein
VKFNKISGDFICYGNHLTELNMPKYCEWVDCGDNLLTSLVIPEGCKSVYCENNPLKSIHLHKSIKQLCIDAGVLTPEQFQWCLENDVLLIIHV